MSQDTINLLLGLLAGSPLVLYVVQQFYLRKKNKADYGDDLLDVMNKTAASIKQAREDLTVLENERRVSEKQHEEELAELKNTADERQEQIEKKWHERQERMKARINELEKTIVNYEISFTLTTNPTVQVTNLKVIGRDDVMASQRMRAITSPESKAKK